jgi:hypothetical protein
MVPVSMVLDEVLHFYVVTELLILRNLFRARFQSIRREHTCLR